MAKRIVRFLETMCIEKLNLSSDIPMTALLSHGYIRVLVRTASCDLASHMIQAAKMTSLHDEVVAMTQAIESVFLPRLSHQVYTSSVENLVGSFYGDTRCGLLQQWIHDATVVAAKVETWIVLDGAASQDMTDAVVSFLEQHMNMRLFNMAKGIQHTWRLVVETDMLAQVSPSFAAVSGHVYMDADCLTWRQILSTWCQRPGSNGKVHSKAISDTAVWVMTVTFGLLKQPTTTRQTHHMLSVCRLVDMVVEADGGWPAQGHQSVVLAEGYFVFAAVWCIGGGLEDGDVKQAFSDSLKEVLAGTKPHMRRSAVPFPPGTSKAVFDFVFDSPTLSWRLWEELPPPSTASPPQPPPPSAGIVVPHSNVAIGHFFSRMAVCNHYPATRVPIVFTGPTACGKSMVLQAMLLRPELDPQLLAACRHRSSYTTKQLILEPLVEIRQHVMGTRTESTHLVLLDDVHVSADTGLDFIREWTEDKNHSWLVDTRSISVPHAVFLATMRHSSKPCVSGRILRHFVQIRLAAYTDSFLLTICTVVAQHAIVACSSLFPFGNQVAAATAKLVHHLRHNTALGWNVLARGLDVLRVVCGMPGEVYASSGVAMLWSHECQREYEDVFRSVDDVEWFRQHLVSCCASVFGNDDADKLTTTFRLNPLMYSPNIHQPQCYEEIFRTKYLTDTLGSWLKSHRSGTNHRDTFISSSQAGLLARVLRVLTLPLRKHPRLTYIFTYGPSGGHTVLASTFELAGHILDVPFHVEPHDRILTYLRTNKPPQHRPRIVFVHNATSISQSDWNDLQVITAVSPVFVVFAFDVSSAHEASCGSTYTVLCDRPSLYAHSHILWLVTKSDGTDVGQICRSTLKHHLIDHPMRDTLMQMYAEVQVLNEAHLASGSVDHAASLTRFHFSECVAALLSHTTHAIKDAEKLLSNALIHASHVTTSIHDIAVAIGLLSKRIHDKTQRAADCSRDLVPLQQSIHDISTQLGVGVDEIRRESAECDLLTDKLASHMDPYDKELHRRINDVLSFSDDWLDEPRSSKLPSGLLSQMTDVVAALGAQVKGIKDSVAGTIDMDDKKTAKKGSVRFTLQRMLTHFPGAPASILAKIKFMSNMAKADMHTQSPCVQTLMACLDYVAKWQVGYDASKKIAVKIQDSRARIQSIQARNAALHDMHCVVANQLGMTQADMDSRKRDLDVLERQMEHRREARRVVESSQEYLDHELIKWNDALEAEQLKLAWLPGMCAVAASTFVYLKPYPWPTRQKVLDRIHSVLQAHQILLPSDTSLGFFAHDRTDVEGWHLHGLPRSSFYVSNAVLTVNAIPALVKWTVLIDPEMVAKTWLASMYRGHLICTSSMETVLQRAILRAIKLHHPLLIENVEGQFSGSLSHFLKVRCSDGVRYLRVDDRMERLQADWAVYFTTPIRYPTFSAAVHREFHVVNFSLSSADASDFFDVMCLDMWDDKECSKQRQASVDYADSCRDLREAEHALLVQLASSSPTKEDQPHVLLELLEDINRKQVATDAKKDEVMVDHASKHQYADAVVPLATLMFDCVVGMGLVNHQYTISLDEFVRPLRAFVTKLRSEWQVATLRGGVDARTTMLQRSSSRRLTSNAASSTANLRKKPMKKILKPDVVYTTDQKALLGAFSASMTKLLHPNHVLLWRFLVAATRILHTPAWMTPCAATTSLYMDIACILDNQCYAFPVSGVDHLRRPAWVSKAAWANLCVITKHRGFEYMYEYVLTHEHAIVHDDWEHAQALGHLNNVAAALLHQFVLLLCLQSPRRWAALNDLVQFAWQDIAPSSPPTSVVRTLAHVLDATDQTTPIMVFCDDMPTMLMVLQQQHSNTIAPGRTTNPLVSVLSGENDAVSTLLDELDRATTTGTWMCLFECNRTSVDTWEKLSLAWQEAINQKPQPQHRLWFITDMQRPISSCIATNAAKRWFVHPISDVKMAIESCAAVLEKEAATVADITQWDVVANGLMNAAYFDWMHHAQVDDNTLETAAKELVVVVAKGLASSIRDCLVRVYAAYIVNKHQLDRLQYLFDWNLHACQSVSKPSPSDVVVSPTTYAACQDWLAAQVPYEHTITAVPVPLALEPPVNVFSQYRQCFPGVAGYDVAHNDQALIHDLGAFSHDLKMSFYDVLASARTFPKTSELHRYLHWEWLQFSSQVSHIQRALAQYLQHISDWYDEAQQVLLGKFPSSWYLTPQFRMKTCAQLLTHVKRGRKFFHSVEDGTFTTYWLPALTDPHRAVELLTHHVIQQHPDMLSSWEHLTASFFVADSLLVRSPLIYRLAKQRIKLRKAAAADTTAQDIHLSGILAYNATWDESTRTLVKPCKINMIEELPPIHMTVTKAADVTDPLSYDQDATDVHEMPVHVVDNKTSPPTQHVVFSVWIKLPDDDDDRRWLLANAYFVIG
ncbi:hypothetical protein B5M09_001246 [Aphanomyces astaci]|uniref:Dynein heavy chain AAA 5 extension domain-containing protein n=1 Tax=Aphanomyces astaci TaxID=112090 RepID=A0A3R8D955_APHAT|nr:hypothetical protein B5M09_001246 [Aphanomyces astaci]